MSNFLRNLLSAVNNCQQTMQWQQIADTNSTINNANLEQSYYAAWNTQLARDASKVTAAGTTGDDLTKAQQQYQVDSALAQTQENTCDSATQAAQQAVGQDGTNLQNQAQLASTLNTIGSNLANLIGHAYS
jgi:hypothetical protein